MLPGSTLGNFYCNFTTRGPSADHVVRVLADKGHRAFVTPTIGSHAVVFEKAADELDPAAIDRVGTLLSCELACPVLAVAVADDDELWAALYESGERQVEYSSRGANRGAYAFCRAFGRGWRVPWVWLLLQWPYLVFETFRHALLVKALDLPRCSVGMGYRYIDRGEPPEGVGREDLLKT